MFRRRRSADASQEWQDDPDYEDEPAEEEESGPAEPPRAEGGPWDAAEPHPQRERVDLGSLRVPVGPE